MPREGSADSAARSGEPAAGVADAAGGGQDGLVGDEVRYKLIPHGEYGEVAKVSELLRTDVKVPDDYRARRRPAEVSAHDKSSGYLVHWNDERHYGFFEVNNGTTVLVNARDLHGAPLNLGDKAYFEVGQGRNGKPKAYNITSIERPKGGKRGGKGGGKARGKKGGKGGPASRRRRRSTSSSHRRRRQRRRKSTSSDEKVIKKEVKTEPAGEQAEGNDEIDAAADAAAALAVMTAFRTRAHAAMKQKMKGLPK
eukprot:gene19633-biopygen35701